MRARRTGLCKYNKMRGFWFFLNDDNKLTMDRARLTVGPPILGGDRKYRVRGKGIF